MRTETQRERLMAQMPETVDEVTMHHRRVWLEPWAVIEERKRQLLENGESLVERIEVAPLPTKYGPFTLVAYGDKTTGEEHFAAVYGDWERGSLGDGEGVLVRIHSSCITSQVFGATNCECPEQLDRAMRDIAGEKRGVFVHLHQEGRGNGTVGKMLQLRNMFVFDEDGQIQDTGLDTHAAFLLAGYSGERRDFTVAGDILHDLGVQSVRLETNNPAKVLGMEGEGISVIRVSIVIPPPNGMVARDIEAKRDKLGHVFD